MKKKNIHNLNPYITSYLSLALLCCIILSVLFLYINLENTRRSEISYNQKKIDLVAEDFATQINTFEEIDLKISVNTLYQPFYFERNKYYEITLLDDFAQYINYSPLIREYFLYYKNMDIIFHSGNKTINKEAYLDQFGDQDSFEITRLLNQSISIHFYYTSDNLFVFLPVTTIHTGQTPNAVLCMVIDHASVNDRIQTVSGGLEGTVAIYSDGQLLYSNAAPPEKNNARGLSCESPDGRFSVLYQPDRFTSYNLIPLQILLVFAVIILILFISSLFAYHSYRPLMKLTQKYRNAISTSLNNTPVFENKLDELNFMMESVLKQNTTVSTQLEEYQGLLRDQILILILNGNYSFDINPYLSQANILLPGPYFFVVSINFQKENAPDESVYQQMKQLFEELSDPGEEIYVYSVISMKKNIISSLCSISDPSQREEVFEEIIELSENFEFKQSAECGNICNDLSHISASYLESLDMQKNPHMISEDSKKDLDNDESVFNKDDFYPVISALSEGDENTALQAFSSYIKSIEKRMPSLLMQQYIFASFLGEFIKVSHEYHIFLSKQSISLMLSSRDIPQFTSSVETAIRDFCAQFREQKSRLEEDKSYQVYTYMNNHFMDYEISIENVAEQLNTTTAFVRNAIQQHSGKKYKDYLIFLRIEYAKKLLASDHLTVAETCQKVGYTNISYFIKAFKNQTGVTPANYKNGN